ncbi:hypothetical protein PsAD46_00849 [Pseudovibrio sp. Ad46]|nr:hypothetical protein PsAD5_02913 [Pseudovibrio sp. Ad5]KZK95156.1 hypothetical protein PsAD46_00849 [Pseudovibrio sp. Ad46]
MTALSDYSSPLTYKGQATQYHKGIGNPTLSLEFYTFTLETSE